MSAIWADWTDNETYGNSGGDVCIFIVVCFIFMTFMF